MIAGGPKMSTLSDILQTVYDSMEAGACGIFFGRNVFQASDPAKMVKALRAMIHDNASLNDAKLIAQQSP
jgi:DhnA family fructose-bisphosphate aldolase class Ia